MRTALAASALAVLALAAAPAMADTPKYGTYIDVKLQIYVKVNKTRTGVGNLMLPCMAAGQQRGAFKLPRRIGITSKGRFSFSGPATLIGLTSGKRYAVKLNGSFTKGRAKGTFSADAASGCEKTSFSAKYYGVNPKG